ncbi:aminodeoxychorismate lyase [Thermomonas sp.]|uniref:aminodeoxychorismate lyase n=1 Tax=Thermomonas sp. TaxID=1971895 RepID=UPI0024892981|nr:aminodeoxychorismate lyase [Thermomonas sp.]MDI1253781.1 aminodeoxychorismate lyase [Thermomonas sp.]
MKARIFIGETTVDVIPADDRGLAYGDGVFETMRVHASMLPLWPRHRKRLMLGAQQLGLALPRINVIEAHISEAIAGVDAGVLKLLVTRGSGGRGYAPPADPVSMWMLTLHPLPSTSSIGLRLHCCQIRLAAQPALAGIKHCNRLEQVLARAECDQAGCDEGLMLSTAGDVVCATAANLLILREGRWTTPPVEASGVAGVCRGWLIEQGLVAIGMLTPHEVETADALALCNALRGILPVSSLGTHEYHQHPAVAALQTQLAAAFPMFQVHKEVA